MAILKEIFTDAKGRPEIKNILGITATIIGLILGVLMVIGVVPKSVIDWTGWIAYMGFASGLIVTTAITDAQIDKGN